MWEIAKSTSHKQGFMRRTISFVIAILLAIVFVFLFSTQPASAADASWTNTNSIKYSNNTYTGPAPKTTNQLLGLDESSQSYVYVEPPAEQDPNKERKIHIIYFEPGVDIATSTTAKYKNYTYINASSFKNPSSEKAVSIDTAQATTSPQTSSCDSGAIGHGMGWIICPVTNFLANGMDFAYKTLSDFLFIRPASNDQNSALYRAWSYMRNIANIAFVIAFLVVIYSQLTTLGVSNYGIKRLLPRLIIAAILVNLSYYICAIAIDISNILGYSLQDAFLWIRNGLVGTTGNSWDVTSWSSITGVILSGGTAVAAGTTALVITLSSYGVAGSLFLLLPALMSGLMAVIVALVVIAGRQALITILAIISPLAFVAYLLPNTEKLFEKWKSMFITLLVLFPAFSVIFGGAQLAGTAIIQNANSFNAVILGMLIQVFPLFITPMLIKLGGSALAGLANIVNNPNRGLIDRTRKFTEDRAENIKSRRLATRNPNRGQLLVRNAQRRDHNRRIREGRRTRDNKITDARWKNSEDYRRIDQGMRRATESEAIGELRSENRYLRSNDHRGMHTQAYNLSVDKQFAEQSLERDLNALIQTDQRMIVREAQLRTTIRQKDQQKLNLDNVFEELAGGKDTSQGQHLAGFVTVNADITRDVAIAGLVTKSAQRMQGKIVYEALKDTQTVAGVNAQGQNLTFADIAGGIDPLGASRARAAAESESAKALSENVAAAGILLSEQNYTNDELIRVANGGLRGGVPSSTEQQIAAAQKIIQIGYEPEMAQLIENTVNRRAGVTNGVDDAEEVSALQKALGAALATSSKRPKWFPGPSLGELSRGEMSDSPRQLVIKTLKDQKISMEILGDMPLEEMQRINKILVPTTAAEAAEVSVITAAKRDKIREVIEKAMLDERVSAKFTPDQVEQLKKMRRRL